jgi:D-alanyl-D-alanine carboxypeptidase
LHIKVSKQASTVIGTSANLAYGDVLSVYDLFYGLMLPSGNDAALVLAQGIGTLL